MPLKPYAEWRELPLHLNLSADHVLAVTIHLGFGVEELAEFLDDRYPGILKHWASQYVDEAKRFVEQAFAFEDEVLTMFIDPYAYFDVTDDDEVRKAITAKFMDAINEKSDQSAIRAMIALIEFSLGHYVIASDNAEFAVCEDMVDGFGDKLYSDEARQALITTQQRKAEIFVDLLKDDYLIVRQQKFHSALTKWYLMVLQLNIQIHYTSVKKKDQKALLKFPTLLNIYILEV